MSVYVLRVDEIDGVGEAIIFLEGAFGIGISH
jgi:hypothetical protein